MTWVAVIAVAALAFLLAAVALRLPKSGHTLLGAALLFGLAGYALQGVPEMPAAPGLARVKDRTLGADLVAARREFYDPAMLPSRFLLTSDAFARRGDTANAAGFARSAVLENPLDGEAWTALGNAISEHAGGRLTPAARYAFARGRKVAPDTPAPAFFLGFALLRDGKPDEAREVWADLLSRAPSDAAWRPGLAARVARLDAMLAAGVR